MYYEDLDIIYEQFFQVEELPEKVRQDINYLGDIILKVKNADRKRVNEISEMIMGEYPNLYRRYNKIITKAQSIGELDG